MASPAATAADGPPDDPPGTCAVFQGFRVGKKEEFSVEEPMANSSVFPLPTNTEPASRSLRTTVASYGERYPLSIWEPAVVSASTVHNTSLIEDGMPVNGPAVPSAMDRSASAACSRATSGMREMWQPSNGSIASMRTRCTSVNSDAEIWRES